MIDEGRGEWETRKRIRGRKQNEQEILRKGEEIKRKIREKGNRDGR